MFVKSTRFKQVCQLLLSLIEALMANYSEDEITKIAVILEYVALDFFNRFMDVALAKWVRTTGYRLYIICYNL